jgi:hypothetical protein
VNDNRFEVSSGEQTARAASESQHLQKTLGRVDIIFLIVAAVVSIEVPGPCGSNNPPPALHHQNRFKVPVLCDLPVLPNVEY